MIKSRKFSLILTFIFIFTIFFTQSAMAMDQNPFTKTNTLNSVESKSSITLKVSATNQSAAEQQALSQLMPILSYMGIDMDTKLSKTSDNTNTDGYVNMVMHIAGLSMNMEAWVKASLTAGKPNFSEIIKLPKGLPIPMMANKDYIVLDSSALNNLTSDVKVPTIDYTKLTDLTNQLTSVTNSLVSDLQTKYNLQVDKGATTVTTPGGIVTAHAYEIKLDDATFKLLLKDIVNNIAQNKELMNSIKAYMTSIDPTASLNDFDNQLASSVAEINKILDTLKDVKLIGDKGLVIDYAVDSDGYIVSETVSINLVFDLGKLIPILNNMMATGNATTVTTPNTITGIYNLGIDYTTVNYNLNKDMKIDFPQLTPDNSMSFTELMNSLTPPQTLEPPTPIIVPVKPITPPKKVLPVKKPVITKKVLPTKKPVITKKVISTKKLVPAKKTTPVPKKKVIKKVVKKTHK